MKKACVIGWPIEHSRSPSIHGYWLEKYGIEGSYTKVAVPREELAAFLHALSERGFAGCNVTVPHKEAAFALADVRAPSSVAVGAANTLWLENGALHAANTDTYGFMTYLGGSAPDWASHGGPVCILGAGGAARAIVHGFLEAGVKEIRLFNRSRDRAGEVARHFGGRIDVYAWEDRSVASRDAAVLVNTTAVGMKDEGTLGLDFGGFDRRCTVCDIVYVPLVTGLISAARAAGLRTVDGLGMLLHQAVPGFEKWFGIKPEVTPALFDLISRDIEKR